MSLNGFNTGISLPFKKEYEEFEEQLNLAAPGPEFRIEEIQEAIGIAENKVGELQNYLRTTQFASNAEEIAFFKEVKPVYYAQFLFYSQLHDIVLNSPFGAPDVEENYWKMHLDRLYRHFITHEDFYRYYRRGASNLDETYFLRHRPPAVHIVKGRFVDLDERVSTGYDIVMAEIIANARLRTWLLHTLQLLRSPGLVADGNTAGQYRLTWTASLAAFNEFIYGLKGVRAVNHGNVTIGDLAEGFATFLNIKPGNVHRRQQENRIRKDPAQFLHEMIDSYLRDMNYRDEHPHKSTK